MVEGVSYCEMPTIPRCSPARLPRGGSYSALVFPGTYDLYYAQSSAGPAVPINDLAKIQSGIVVGAAPVSLDIDVPGSKVSGTVTVNGAAISGAAKGAGSLRLVTAAGDATELTGTSTSGGSYSALVVPGSYDLYYGESSAGTSVPSNTSAKLQSGIVVGSAPLALDVNISATAVSGSFTINGATVASAIEQQGSLTLANAAGDQAPLGTYSAATGSYSGRVVPGTYDLYWSGSGADVPSNRSAKIQTGIVVGSSALVLDVDLLASTVSGTVTINGATDSALGNGISYLTLRGAAGDTAPITVSSAGSYSARVMPGTYDLYYGSKDAPLNVGARNVAAKIQSGIVVGASALTLNINVPVSTVSGNVAINGAAASAPGKNAFLLHLRNAAGDSALIASFPQGSYSASVVPGNYDLYYTKQGNGGLEIPSNIPAKIRSGIVVGSLPLSLDVDVPGSIVSGTITVNGVPNAGSSGDLGFVALLDAEGNASSLTSASSGMGTYSAFVVPGRYELYYLLYRGGPTIPSNSHFHLGCFIVP